MARFLPKYLLYCININLTQIFLNGVQIIVVVVLVILQSLALVLTLKMTLVELLQLGTEM